MKKGIERQNSVTKEKIKRGERVTEMGER